YVAVVDREETPEHVLLLLVPEVAFDGQHGEPRVLVIGAARVVLELIAQAWHHREARSNTRELLEQPGHVQVVLGRMQPHPGQDEFAGLRVLVIGLMHVPDDRDRKLAVHSAASARRLRTNARSSDATSHAARGPLGFPSSAM